MKAVNAGYVIINELNITKKIEKIARVCYKSENCIKEGSDLAMISRLVKNKHYAMLEHGTLTYEVSKSVYKEIQELLDETMNRQDISVPRLHLSYNCQENRYVISGNLRTYLEFFEAVDKSYLTSSIPLLYEHVHQDSNGCIEYEFKNIEQYYNTRDKITRIDDFNELSVKERMIHETVSVLFTIDKGVSHELVRHRDASFAQESSRYCSYDKGKFGSEITCIKPCFWNEGTPMYEAWKASCEFAEKTYMDMLKNGATPQEARSVLPHSLKADITCTANLYEWQHIFDLRALDKTGPAHPQMKEVMVPLYKEFEERYPTIFKEKEDLEPELDK